MAKKINLALQGGGAHGAYGWGVLDRLLEEESVEIEGISGTSAGAINAAVLIQGYMEGGRAGARKKLETFWRKVSDANRFGPWQKNPVERFWSGGNWNMNSSPLYQWYDAMTHFYSPYDTNPLNINPLSDILNEMLDFKAIRRHEGIKLFVTATHVQSGQARIFRCHEIDNEVLLASACIPFLFQAIEIGGEQYWDGGYMGNPAIWPLIYHCESEDVVLVQINPIRREEKFRSATEIMDRLNEITFNSSLIAEMRAIEFVSRLLHEGRLDKDSYKDMRIHLIYSGGCMHNLNASSKMNADWDFFLYLKEIGRKTAEEWLKRDLKMVGVKSTIDIREKFLRGPAKGDAYGPSDKKGKHHEKQQVKQRKQVKPAVNVERLGAKRSGRRRPAIVNRRRTAKR
jgi:NTE family protein